MALLLPLLLALFLGLFSALFAALFGLMGTIVRGRRPAPGAAYLR
ncbi:hypothetical protein [Streptomyces niveus]